MHILTSMAGQRMTPQGEAIFLVLWGIGLGLMGWSYVRKAGAIATAADQMQHDIRVAYHHGRWPTAEEHRRRRVIARIVGALFAILGATLAIVGLVLLITQ